MIDIDNLHKRYRTADGRVGEVLKGLSLRVPASSITAVVGPSGAGNRPWRAASACWNAPIAAVSRLTAKTCHYCQGRRCGVNGARSAPFFNPQRC